MRVATSCELTLSALQVLGPDSQPYPDVYALGDCAAVGAHGFAPTAQVAEQQGQWLAQWLNSSGGVGDIAGTNAFRYAHRGSLANIGASRWVSHPAERGMQCSIVSPL